MNDIIKLKNEKKYSEWKRMAFKGNKIWVRVDEDDKLINENGKATGKYQIDQDYEYRIRVDNLKPLDSLKDTPRKKTKNNLKKSGKQSSGQINEDLKAIQNRAICVYTDGASSGNPGPAGIGVWFSYKNHEKSISKYIGETTNNVAELEAIRAGLSEIKNHDLPIRLFTDSGYAYGLLVLGWKPQKNQNLVKAIKDEIKKFKNIKLVKVKGHSGDEGNERADRLATTAIQNAQR
jgi:ribonuclease HI